VAPTLVNGLYTDALMRAIEQSPRQISARLHNDQNAHTSMQTMRRIANFLLSGPLSVSRPSPPLAFAFLPLSPLSPLPYSLPQKSFRLVRGALPFCPSLKPGRTSKGCLLPSHIWLVMLCYQQMLCYQRAHPWCQSLALLSNMMSPQVHPKIILFLNGGKIC